MGSRHPINMVWAYLGMWGVMVRRQTRTETRETFMKSVIALLLLSALCAPTFIAPTKFGHFRGVVRAADLDAHRFEIRNVESFGSIRCIYKPEMQAQIKRCFDHLTEVTGHYESGANGAPRLLIVEKVKVLKRQHLDNPLPFYRSQ
jgi:hypothetical protein